MAICIDRLCRPEVRRTAEKLLAASCIAGALGAMLAAGCGGDGVTTRVVSGSVTVGGKPVATGQVRFVPIRGTPGPASLGQITDGEYRIEARGGVPVGTHRVEIVEYGKGAWDGRGFEPRTLEEEVAAPQVATSAAGPYAGKNSPLEVEVKATGEARFDFDLPAP